MIDRPVVVRLATYLATVVAAGGILSLGSSAATPNLEVGDPAPQTFIAQRNAPVTDTVETERLRQEARDNVEPIFIVHPEIETDVIDQVNGVFDAAETLVVANAPDSPPTTLPDPTTTTTEPSDESSTTEPENDPATVSGVLFIDVDDDGAYNPTAEGSRVDIGLARVSLRVATADDAQNVTTDANGEWEAEVAPGEVVVTIDETDEDIPDGYIVGGDSLSQEITCDPGDTCEAEPMGFVANLRTLDQVTNQISDDYLLDAETVTVLVAAASDDVIRSALGEPLHLFNIRQAALQRVYQEFATRITPDQIPEARTRQQVNPPLVGHPDTGQDAAGQDAAGDIVSTFLQANYLVDPTLTETARTENANTVQPVEIPYAQDQVIVAQGELVTQLDIDAGIATGAFVDPVQEQGGLLAVVAILVGLLGLYLARFRPEFWARPRMVALLGILLVLASAAVRLTVAVAPDTSWYVLPAATFGFVTAVLFDSRIAVLMALSVGVLTAVGTQDIGVTVYGVLATMAPIPFVSSVSTRGAFRNAVIFSGFTAALAAAATAWFFHVGPNDDVIQVIGTSAAWAFGVSVIASLVGLAALQFFESAFDITTALSLLDLTDRNHEALQLLQEKAFGTFNHSLMVGTLSHAAARAIGANALLARAMAYYHDLGKTENPTYFIENQFGIPNPHDRLSPYESAEIIRNHVTDGVALARQFKIPSDVTTGIVSHHGDGVMRYFYEKARQELGEDADPNDFRHVGHKPRTAESAIVMLADSLEAACRAVFQTEEPTPEAIEKVVARIIDEKLNDGQLEESPLTLSELTLVRRAFLDSLIGHYHQRIAYPDFSTT